MLTKDEQKNQNAHKDDVLNGQNRENINLDDVLLGKRVKIARKAKRLTQEELAMKSGVGLNFVRNLEQGKSSLRMDKVNQLLDLFNYTLTATPKY